MQLPLMPVGHRPRCLDCNKELRPNYEWQPVPFRLNKEEQRAWRKANPRRFKGSYGAYEDNRFCGLFHGYRYAVAHSKPAKVVAPTTTHPVTK